MAHETETENHERRISELEDLIKGSYHDGKKVDGLMDLMGRVCDALFGNERTGAIGLVQTVSGLTDTVKKATAVLLTVQTALVIGWMVFTHFHK